jgi:DNA-binding response OmpR family regulator
MAYILIVDSQTEFRQQLVLQLDKASHRAAAVATVSAATKLMED